ncbi:hypothetical protein [Romboutsia sp.]|uniref:hypothetical protein n=1 Tax=Romboutsia sp. TaxID=1965302 RepID=UPI003F31842E
MICSNCSNSNLTEVKSVTNSTYFYCKSCNHSLETTLKQTSLDIILNSLCQTLKSSDFNSLKIQIEKVSDNLLLFVNDVKIKNINFEYDFSKMDVYFLENTIHDLTEDFCDLDISKIDILVCS